MWALVAHSNLSPRSSGYQDPISPANTQLPPRFYLRWVHNRMSVHEECIHQDKRDNDGRVFPINPLQLSSGSRDPLLLSWWSQRLENALGSLLAQHSRDPQQYRVPQHLVSL